MNRKSVVPFFAALTLIVAGCAYKRTAPMAQSMALTTLAAPSQQRYIAERDKLELITPESELQKSWESAVAFCPTIQCEVVS